MTKGKVTKRHPKCNLRGCTCIDMKYFPMVNFRKYWVNILAHHVIANSLTMHTGTRTMLVGHTPAAGLRQIAGEVEEEKDEGYRSEM